MRLLSRRSFSLRIPVMSTAGGTRAAKTHTDTGRDFTKNRNNKIKKRSKRRRRRRRRRRTKSCNQHRSPASQLHPITTFQGFSWCGGKEKDKTTPFSFSAPLSMRTCLSNFFLCAAGCHSRTVKKFAFNHPSLRVHRDPGRSFLEKNIIQIQLRYVSPHHHRVSIPAEGSSDENPSNPSAVSINNESMDH